MLLAVLERGPGLSALSALVLAGTPEEAREVLAAWSSDDRVRVSFVAGFDFLFGIVWANTMALACIWSARRLTAARLAGAGAALAWLLWFAVLLDIPENGAYVGMVLGSLQQPWPALAALAVYARIAISLADGPLRLIRGLAGLAAPQSVGRREIRLT